MTLPPATAAGEGAGLDARPAPSADEAARSRGAAAPPVAGYDLVVVANRLPVEGARAADGLVAWRRSPGGLVAALEPILRARGGAWVGWCGSPGDASAPFDAESVRLVGVALSGEEVEDYYEGFSNSTLWPLYHDVIVPPEFRRRWWRGYVQVNARFARTAAAQAAPGATVWVHDYQLQLVPAMLRAQRPDLRIGFFNHIPFPGYEIFAQLPWRRQILEGLLGADLLGFQRQADAGNFLRACRRAAGLPTDRGAVHVSLEPGRASRGASPGEDDAGERGSGGREVQARALPISIDSASFAELARRDDVRARAREIRMALGDPRVVLLGVDRLDYTKGIPHRLRAYAEILETGELGPPEAVLVQVATPSRERVEQYRLLRDEVEGIVGRINGEYGLLGHPPVHYLHHAYPREELAALYLAADVMLVTSLRDGMNLVAKEYVACRGDETGALVLSEFTGAADELVDAFLVNPHNVEGTKDAILRAARIPPGEATRRMQSLRRRVHEHDVHCWATSFLDALHAASARLGRNVASGAGWKPAAAPAGSPPDSRTERT